MFEGYNLILITAEGFSPYAVHKEVTPTLYKLVNEGFVFNNFYTALWQTSTSDGEFVALTGLIPVGTRSMYKVRNNLLPFSLGHQFNLLGIESKAYHNHTYTYYDRDETHPNLGYLFKAKGNGLILDSDVWPESDLEMIQHTVDEFIHEDQFHIYYLTVSGHMNYTFIGNSMAFKNKDLVKDLPYSSDARAYIACQIELDRALEELIRRLIEAGIAEKTVIALSSDHYPYGWEKERLDELAGHEVDPNFEVYRNHFILWNPGMENNIIIDKPASSMDILPTLCNLFGLTYDSRLLMGRDILSDSEPLVILSNRSFITDKAMYNSVTNEVINLTDEELPRDYVKNMNAVIKNKFTVSKSIIQTDYYRYVFPNYPEEFIKADD
jgi:phosphoglycerol transferase MdoB-like AlkP superfamily enzyme